MNCEQITKMIGEGLSLKHCLLIRFLMDNGGTAYLVEARDATRLPRVFIERCYQKKHLFEKVTLEKKQFQYDDRPSSTGIALTPEAKVFGEAIIGSANYGKEIQ
tara:strand:- start:117 stop:428 length:312 start_codon:yes stop_codon:yes gene_type:complete